MKKKILSFALLAAMSATAFAQTPIQACASPQRACETEVCIEGVSFDPFSTLNLTEQQRTQLDALKQQRPSKEDIQKARQEKKDMRQAERKNYLNQVKAILTPEQYVEFLEVSYLTPQQGFRANKGMQRGAKNLDLKGRKDGKKKDGVKCDKKDGKKCDKQKSEKK